MELNTVKEIVEKLLKENEILRGDDDLLYLEILKKISPAFNTGTITTDIQNVSIGDFFKMRKNKKLPSFESVRRSRQKVQEENAGLKPCEMIQKARNDKREEMYHWSKLKQQSLEFSVDNRH